MMMTIIITIVSRVLQLMWRTRSSTSRPWRNSETTVWAARTPPSAPPSSSSPFSPKSWRRSSRTWWGVDATTRTNIWRQSLTEPVWAHWTCAGSGVWPHVHFLFADAEHEQHHHVPAGQSAEGRPEGSQRGLCSLLLTVLSHVSFIVLYKSRAWWEL